MYTQRDEEPVILDQFPKEKPGRFLDLGAFDGKTFSNVKALADRGWSGVLVEVSPHVFPTLIDTYPDPERFTLVNALIGRHAGVRDLHLTTDAVSTTSDQNFAVWKDTVRFRPVLVAEMPLSDLLGKVGHAFDFVSIDLEGESLTMLTVFLTLVGLAGAPKPQVVCVEHDNDFSGVGEIEARFGYKEVHRTAENSILVKG